VNRFRFVEDHRGAYGVKRLCRVLGVARSGFYGWLAARPAAAGREQADKELAAVTSATARRVVRSEPVNPITTSRRCTTSAPTRPPERATNSSIFGRYSSIGRARCSLRLR
jgi:hypothetical protein